MREIVLDTETTGFDPLTGDRVVEIGCLELMDHIPTGSQFHKYINPERSMPEGAFKVHGLGDEFLAKQPVFAAIVDEFLAFIGDATLIAHNATFDMKFLNAELVRLKRASLPDTRALDTLPMARQKFPGSPATLDALCRRFNVDTSSRTLHGALLDAELLADVYIELLGGRQPDLILAGETKAAAEIVVARPFHAPRPHAPSPEEAQAHAAMVAKLDHAMWLQVAEAEPVAAQS